MPQVLDVEAAIAARKYAVIVDEAHAARRQVFRDNEPNLALRLLQELRARQLFRCLWLLTATPMQLDPDEVHLTTKLDGTNTKFLPFNKGVLKDKHTSAGNPPV